MERSAHIYQAARAHEFTIIISPHRALRPRNPPARMVRSAVLLFGDVCGMIVGVGCVGVFWNGHEDRFTNPTEPLRIATHQRAWYVPRSFYLATFAE